ncbi:MAG: hypothetical protein N3H84_05295 [Candidatus Caldarchaeum sp.]|nr:hypothetical protein [Candidatus Caldarchaeum sp.]
MTTPSVKDFFTGDFKEGISYLVYGDDKAGKTTLLLYAALKTVEKAGKVLWVDCGARLYFTRLHQIIPPQLLDKIYVTQPRSFREQLESIINVHDFLPSDTRLVVVDDFTYLHRLELSGNPSKDLPIYRALSLQAALLKDVAMTRKASVVVVGLVHEIPVINVVAPVAGRIVSYWADFVAKLVRRNGYVEMVEEKPSTGRMFFRIVDRGVDVLGFR